MYDEVEYWNERNNPNSNKPNTSDHIQFVKEQINGSHKILDFGCGIGRIFPAYENIEHVEGYDISKAYEKRIIEESKKYDFTFHLHIEDKILDRMPYKDNEFNCAVAVSVLLHQRPEHILNVMAELIRISKKVVVISWHDPKEDFDIPYSQPGPKRYCFNYDFPTICKLNAWEINMHHVNNKSIYFTFD